MMSCWRTGPSQGQNNRRDKSHPLSNHVEWQLVEARYVDSYRVYMKFEDGTEGVVDLGCILSGRGVFEALDDVRVFRAMRFDPEANTIVWPTGADLAPEFLYEKTLAASRKAKPPKRRTRSHS
jgi:hypothetical protein